MSLRMACWAKVDRKGPVGAEMPGVCGFLAPGFLRPLQLLLCTLSLTRCCSEKGFQPGEVRASSAHLRRQERDWAEGAGRQEGNRGSLHLEETVVEKLILGAIISVQVALSQNDLNRPICLLTCSQPAPSSVAPAAIISGTTFASNPFPAAWENGLVLCLKETQPLFQPGIKEVWLASISP